MGNIKSRFLKENAPRFLFSFFLSENLPRFLFFGLFVEKCATFYIFRFFVCKCEIPGNVNKDYKNQIVFRRAFELTGKIGPFCYLTVLNSSLPHKCLLHNVQCNGTLCTYLLA